MRILFTGASGFLGGQLLRLLTAEGHDVHHLIRRPMDFAHQTVWDFGKDPFPSKIPTCDMVVHLAAHVDFSNTMDVRPYTVNTIGTAAIAKYCSGCGASLLFTSTSGIHGQERILGINSKIAPSAHYGMSKFIGEEIVSLLVQDNTIVRLGGIYGLDGPTHLGLNAAITQAVRYQRSPILVGSGSGRRNYICVDDAAKWLAHIVAEMFLRRRANGEKRQNIQYLASDEIMTIEEYLQSIIEHILPGDRIDRREGSDCADQIVESSHIPFRLTRFADHLQSCKRKMQKGG